MGEAERTGGADRGEPEGDIQTRRQERKTGRTYTGRRDRQGDRDTFCDTSQIQQVASQMFSKKTNFLTENYEDATKEPFSNLLLDMKQSTKDAVRILSNYEVEDSQAPITAYTLK